MNTATWERIVACKLWGHTDPTDPVVRLYAPVDDIHTALKLVAQSAKQALHVAMYGYDDAELDALFRDAWANEHVLVKIALDSSQAAGLAERPLLKRWPSDVYTSSLVIGQSSKHRISHMKLIVADDCMVSGSTNLSGDGEGKQNNECTLLWNARLAQEGQTRISQIFAEMVSQPNCLTHKDLLGS